MAEDAGRLLVRIEATQAKFEKQMAAIAKSGATSAKSVETSFKKANDNIAGSAGGMRNASQAAGQLSFQLNDIATSLAGGASPFQVMMQQGSQVTQVFQGMGGGFKGAASALVGAFSKMLDPISLVSFGLIALTGIAVEYFTSSEDGAEETAKALKKHADELNGIKQRWAETLPGVAAYIDQINELSEATQKAADRQTLLGTATEDLKEQVAPLSVDITDVVNQLQILGGQEDLINKLQEAYAAWRTEVDNNRTGTAELTKMQVLLAQAGIPAAVSLGKAITENLETPIRKAIEATKELNKAFGDMQPPPFLSGIGTAPGIGIAAADAATERLNESLGGAANAIDSFVEHVIQAESAGDPKAKNPLSSATGAGQFTRGTWLSVFKSHFATEAAGMSDAAILALRTDLDANRKMIRAYASDNARALIAGGFKDVTEGMLQLAHFLGAGGALSVLKAAPGTKIADIPGMGDAIAKNQRVLGGGATREDVLAYANRRAGEQTKANAAAKTLADQQADALVKLKEMIATEEQEIALKQKIAAINGDLSLTENERAAAITRVTAEAAKEAEVEKLLQQAKEAGLTITPQLIAQYNALAQAKVDAIITDQQAIVAQKEFTAAQQAAAQAAQQLQGAIKGAMSGLIKDLIAGKDAGEAFANALSKIADQLLDIGLNSLFGTGGGAGGGGLLSTLFGSVLHKGGIAGVHGEPRMVPASAFAGAKRYHSGGMIGAGEVPAILKRGEIVLPDGSARKGGSGETVNIRLHDDSGRMAEIADQRIQTASGTIVKVSVVQSAKTIQRQLPGMMANAQVRNG